MMKITLRSAFRSSAASAALATVFVTTPAFAQNARTPSDAGVVNADTGADSSDDATIVVTGSRIARPDLASSSPVATLSREDMKRNNVTTVEQILSVSPQFSGNTTSASNNPGDGTASANLRNLNPYRTLVLIDGKRAPYYDTQGQVDLNMIPVALIKQVDVLTGGASAVYGSDAIAGVVNFVLDDRFTGFRVDAGTSITRFHDGAQPDVSATAGVKLGDRGNLIISGSYSKRNPVRFGARPRNATSLDPSDLTPTGSTNTNPAVFGIGTNLQQIRPDGSLSSNVIPYDYTPINYVQIPMERYTAMALGRYEITDKIEFYGRASYSHVKVTPTLAPTATNGFTFNVSPDNPLLSAAQRGYFFGPGATINDGSNVANDPTARAGTSAVDIYRRITETPGRVSPYTTKSYQFMGGLRGDVGAYKWDVSAQYSEVKRHIDLQNDLSYSALQQALDVVSGPGGQAQCFDPSNGCVPFNLFQAGALTQQQLGFVLRNGAEDDKTTQFIVNGNVSGDLGFLRSPWANGSAALSVGGEYRRETGRTTVDANYGSGDLIYYGQGQNINGKYDVWELFAEFKMPLVEDKPFIRSLGLEAGYRYSKYSTVGGVSSYKAGGDWSPVEGIRFRGIYQRAVRAPNIYELYSPVVAATGSLNSDPCAGTVSANAQSICRAQGAPASAFTPNGDGTFTSSIQQPNAGQVNIFTGGNPNLTAEKSNTYTIGVVINPPQMRRFSLAVDYFNIDIGNAIDLVPAAATVSQCFAADQSASSPTCQSIVRSPTSGGLNGNIIYGVPSVYGNLARLKTRGIDVTAAYSGGSTEGFNYGVSIAGTFTMDYLKQTDSTSAAVQCAGQYSQSCNIEPISKWKHVAEARLGWKQLSFLTRWRYLGAVHDTQDAKLLVRRIPGISYFDFTVAAAVTEKASVRLGIQNAFDKKSPIVGEAINDYVAGNTFPNTYDVMGRTFFINVSAGF